MRKRHEVLFDHAEVQDRNGNWYNENYRSAKARARYICREGLQTWHPQLTFFGFRYIDIYASFDLLVMAEPFRVNDLRRSAYSVGCASCYGEQA